MTQQTTPTPAVFLMGPTASGKTGLALALAERFAVEIISVDSALVYQDMDIGTAKPSAAEQARCPHHLIDLISPMESYSAAQFYADAHERIQDITRRGKLPLLVGGTMLYFKALEEGLSNLPPADPNLRAQIEADAAITGWPTQHARLMALDPITAARLAPNDSQRIQRALEVCILSGQAMSALLGQRQNDQPTLNILKLALQPSDRLALHARIDTRFRGMLEADFVREVEILRRNYPELTPDHPSMRCVGYRQAWSYLEDEIDRETFIAQGVAATRQLCKRQLTWLRSMPDLQTLDCLEANLVDPAEQVIREWLGK